MQGLFRFGLDMRKVAWDRGPVRCSSKVREDGSSVPLWHDSEVAAVAWPMQNILDLRSQRQLNAKQQTLPLGEIKNPTTVASASAVLAGKKCADCGAHAVIKKDGCDHYTACGFVGACGRG